MRTLTYTREVSQLSSRFMSLSLSHTQHLDKHKKKCINIESDEMNDEQERDGSLERMESELSYIPLHKWQHPHTQKDLLASRTKART